MKEGMHEESLCPTHFSPGQERQTVFQKHTKHLLRVEGNISSCGFAMVIYGQNCQWPMYILPSCADLGKAARDIFNKGFGLELVKLYVRTK